MGIRHVTFLMEGPLKVILKQPTVPLICKKFEKSEENFFLNFLAYLKCIVLNSLQS